MDLEAGRPDQEPIGPLIVKNHTPMQIIGRESGAGFAVQGWNAVSERARRSNSEASALPSPDLPAANPGPFGMVWLASVWPGRGQGPLFNRVFVMAFRRLRSRMHRGGRQGHSVGGLGVGVGHDGR